jgi:hypothetical protein
LEKLSSAKLLNPFFPSVFLFSMKDFRIPFALKIPSVAGMSVSSFANDSNVYLMLLCIAWYIFKYALLISRFSASAITNNIGKQILNQYRYPITLTWVQFGFVSAYSILYSYTLSIHRRIRPISTHVLKTVYPLALFQIFGHIFTSISYGYIAVSFAHTIKVFFFILLHIGAGTIIYSRYIPNILLCKVFIEDLLFSRSSYHRSHVRLTLEKRDLPHNWIPLCANKHTHIRCAKYLF